MGYYKVVKVVFISIYIIYDSVCEEVSTNMEFTRTTQNRNKALHQGHAYVQNKNLVNGWESFECGRRRNHKGCTGRGKINGEQTVIVKEHTHTPNPARNESLRTVLAMRNRAQTTVEPAQQIIGNSIAGIRDVVAAELPNVNTIRRNIRRQRQVANNAIPVPGTRAALPNPLSQEYTTTNAGTPFLCWDSGDQDRILLFATPEKIALLENNNNWSMDGTFDTAPLIYGQLFTIHTKIARIAMCLCTSTK